MDKLMSQAPKSFDQFSDLLQVQVNNDFYTFDENLAQILRMQASTKDYGAIMTSGKSALPYVPWLVDGMLMSNKLIVHLEHDDEKLSPIIHELIDSDIRLSSHYQDQKTFTTDISEHRLDILLLTEHALPEIDNWLKILSDAGLLVLIASEEHRESLINTLSDGYFIINNRQLFISRKGLQHRKKRTRNRKSKIRNTDK